jgi:hypothetical protein
MGILAVVAMLVARRDRDHWPLAAYAAWLPLADLLRIPIRAYRAGLEHPGEGLGRLLFHVGEGLYLTISFGFLAVVLVSFTRAKWWPALAGWAVVLAICLDYEVVRRDVLENLYRTVAIGCMGVGLLAVAHAMLVRRDLQPKLHHLSIMIYLAADVVTYLFPFVGSLYTDWDVVRGINVVMLSVLIVLHAHALYRPVTKIARGVPS